MVDWIRFYSAKAPEMLCERKWISISHHTSYCLIEVVTKADLTVSYIWSWNIPTSRKRRSTDNSVDGYDVSLSYDGTNYGDSVSFIIYDEDCFTFEMHCERKWTSISHKTSYCLIEVVTKADLTVSYIYFPQEEINRQLRWWLWLIIVLWWY
jgi:hypothetical protein